MPKRDWDEVTEYTIEVIDKPCATEEEDEQENIGQNLRAIMPPSPPMVDEETEGAVGGNDQLEEGPRDWMSHIEWIEKKRKWRAQEAKKE